jgi:hypothetical protein
MRFEFSGKRWERRAAQKCCEKSYRAVKPAPSRAGFRDRGGPGTRGYVPRGRKAEDGRIADQYDLVEFGTSSYPARTSRKIEESGGTPIFRKLLAARGEELVRRVAARSNLG